MGKTAYKSESVVRYQASKFPNRTGFIKKTNSSPLIRPDRTPQIHQPVQRPLLCRSRKRESNGFHHHQRWGVEGDVFALRAGDDQAGLSVFTVLPCSSDDSLRRR